MSVPGSHYRLLTSGTDFQGTPIPKDKAEPLSVGTAERVLMARGDPYVPGSCLKAAGGLIAMYERNKALLKIEQPDTWARLMAPPARGHKPRDYGPRVTDLGEFKRNRLERLNDWSE